MRQLIHGIEIGIGLAIVLLCLPSPVLAQLPIYKLSDSLIDPAGLTVTGDYGISMNSVTYQQDAHIPHRGWQYVTY